MKKRSNDDAYIRRPKPKVRPRLALSPPPAAMVSANVMENPNPAFPNGKGGDFSPEVGGYDGMSLSKAKTHWLFGEWNTLAALDLDILKRHPDRARFALLAASAHQQLGDQDKTRLCARLALDWGCSHKLAAKMLVAGVHNTLARASALKRDDERMRQHFRKAISAAAHSSETALISHARSVREITRLGLLPQAASLLNEELHAARKSTSRPYEQHVRIRILENELKQIQNQLRRPAISRARKHNYSIKNSRIGNNPGWLRNRIENNERTVIVVAGMRHSGSTAVFNIIRLALMEMDVRFSSDYSEHVDVQAFLNDDSDVHLIKLHELRDDVVEFASVVITTLRDLRDTVASAVRREFPLLQKLGEVEYAKYNRSIHDIWLPYSDYEVSYARLIHYPVSVIQELFLLLSIENVRPSSIYEAVCSLPVDDYKNTLLSPSHITDPERKLTYRDTLSKEVLEKIESVSSGWLRQYGYSTA